MGYFRTTLSLACCFIISYTALSAEKSMSPMANYAFNYSLVDSFKITYVANMGVLIQNDSSEIIIDALHEFYKNAYSFPTDSQVDMFVKSNSILNVEIAAFTHEHKDHFSVELANRFIVNRSTSIIIASEQVATKLTDYRENSDEDNDSRILVIPYTTSRTTVNHKGIIVHASRCAHSNVVRHAAIQNLAFLVELGDRRILHLGDSNWASLVSCLEALNPEGKRIDYVVMPYWMLGNDDAARLIRLHLREAQILISHLAPDFSEDDIKRIEGNFPDAILLTEKGRVYISEKS